MAIRHDGIIPYLEIGRFSFHAFIPNLEVPNKIDLKITKDVKNPFMKVFQLYEQDWNKSLLIDLLQKERTETIFGLRSLLTKPEVAELNEKKSEILYYLINLEKYYKSPHA